MAALVRLCGCWLVDEQMYSLGSAPKRFEDQSSVKFLCCNKRQYVFGDSRELEPMYINAEM